jgi:hypothetical protein
MFEGRMFAAKAPVKPSGGVWRAATVASGPCVCNPGCDILGPVKDRIRWVFLAYRLPREPSTPRITLWRKLRRLGAVQVVDNLVALPMDARTREQLEWLADEVVEAGGEASIWLAETASAAQERALAAREDVPSSVELRWRPVHVVRRRRPHSGMTV